MLADNDYPSMVEMNSENENSSKDKKHNSRTIFGSYQLLRTIGEGEFGKVKLGVKLNTQSAVAIKLIKKKSVYNQNKLTKLCQEISILEKVNHPYIIKTYEVIEDKDYIGIIMEYASGGELFEYILAHRYLEEYEAKRFFAQLLSGINYLHKNHLVHRDLKLENLLLDSIHNIVITDFGFATISHSDENKLLTTSCGSPCYAAPELVVNDGYVGEAADIWSCGVILYAMICGYLPFDDDPDNPDGENIHLLYKYILETEVSFPDYVSEEAKDLLRGILNPDPEVRFTMEQIINHSWIRDFKEFILIEYDENNEPIIPEFEMSEEMEQMNDNNQNNIKASSSQITSSILQSEINNSSNPILDSFVPDINTKSKNNILQDVSMIDSDQYIDFIKQSDCDTTTSNILNSENSDLIRPPIIKKDSYYTAQSMDLNQISVTTNDTENNDDEELNLPSNISIPMNPKTKLDDNITVSDSISNYNTGLSEVYSNNLSTRPSQISKQSSSCESDVDNYLEQSNKTITDTKRIAEENTKINTILSNSIDQVISPIYSNGLEHSIEEIPLSVNKQTNNLIPKPRNSSLPENNNFMKNKIEDLSIVDDKESSILSQTIVETPTKLKEKLENTTTNIEDKLKEKEKEKEIKKDKENQSECLSKLENLSLDTNKNLSILKDDDIKSIRSDKKSIRSKTDISLMNVENIKITRSNISMSSRRRRLSICTNSTMNTSISTSFYTPSSGKRLSSSINLSLDNSIDSLNPVVGHTSLIIPSIDSSSEKRYSLNAYKQSRNNLNHPNISIISSHTNNTSRISINGPSSKIIQESLYKNLMDTSSINHTSSKKNQGSLKILDELKNDKQLTIIKPLTTADLQLDAIESSSNSEMEIHRHRSKSKSPLKTSSHTKLQSMTEEITELNNEVLTEPKVKIDETALLESNKVSSIPVKTVERELISPKNPYIKYFNGIIDSKALTITPPFVTFLEMQKTLIDMDIDYRVLNNCFKIRCQKVFNSIVSPEDLEALGKASPVISPLHSPACTPTPAITPAITPTPSSPTTHLQGKSGTTNKSKKSISDEITTSSQKIKSKDNDQVSICYSFRSNGSRKIKSIVNSIIDCTKPSLSTPSHSPSPGNRNSSDIHQKHIFNLIKRKKNQSLVIFTMEICRIKNRDELYVIKFKRRKGDAWLFKDLYKQILSKLPLKT
ncbi:Pkinase-domain-containing protein [Neocallimastix californiae]|uniref:non-specific serine/threonine protein kinase n=1 Tax=Neocallimastix californiae TaxID=1754190 RepID=A0A1Y2EPX2_9FUNG|nr:Pkinase-domain-containing protein [Neocallimastix californiae]|eukprot:ORY73568.1 Pkinase-domain-containing protein [Neocallimastix californiae]